MLRMKGRVKRSHENEEGRETTLVSQRTWVYFLGVFSPFQLTCSGGEMPSPSVHQKEAAVLSNSLF